MSRTKEDVGTTSPEQKHLSPTRDLQRGEKTGSPFPRGPSASQSRAPTPKDGQALMPQLWRKRYLLSPCIHLHIFPPEGDSEVRSWTCRTRRSEPGAGAGRWLEMLTNTHFAPCFLFPLSSLGTSVFLGWFSEVPVDWRGSLSTWLQQSGLPSWGSAAPQLYAKKRVWLSPCSLAGKGNAWLQIKGLGKHKVILSTQSCLQHLCDRLLPL